jgi:hypothetical protein
MKFYTVKSKLFETIKFCPFQVIILTIYKIPLAMKIEKKYYFDKKESSILNFAFKELTYQIGRVTFGLKGILYK